jgi:hypothetical protein
MFIAPKFLKEYLSTRKARRANNAAFWSMINAYIYVQNLPCRNNREDVAASDALRIIHLALLELEKSLK